MPFSDMIRMCPIDTPYSGQVMVGRHDDQNVSSWPPTFCSIARLEPGCAEYVLPPPHILTTLEIGLIYLLRLAIGARHVVGRDQESAPVEGADTA